MTEREEITSVKFMNCSNFQRLHILVTRVSGGA